MSDEAKTPLKQWLQDRGYSVYHVARETGVDRQRLQRIAQGLQAPDMRLALVLEKYSDGELPRSVWLQPPADWCVYQSTQNELWRFAPEEFRGAYVASGFYVTREAAIEAAWDWWNQKRKFRKNNPDIIPDDD